MGYNFREYKKEDYASCEALVNQAWNFDGVFQPQAFSSIAKQLYTKGAELESSYRLVAEDNGKVVGFIFGLNQATHKTKRNLRFKFGILWKLFRLGPSKPAKNDLLTAMGTHEKNRSAHITTVRSEIVLFVVDKSYHGKGIGKQLWAGFLEDCSDSGISEIFVETNKQGASGFYENIGFEHLADFDSPLHEFATPDGQACVYLYKLESS